VASNGLLDGDGCLHHTTANIQHQLDSNHGPRVGYQKQLPTSYQNYHQGCTTSHITGSGPWLGGGLGRGRKMSGAGGGTNSLSNSRSAAGGGEGISGGNGTVRHRFDAGERDLNGALPSTNDIGGGQASDQSDESLVQPPRWQRLLVKTISCMLTSLLTVWAGRAASLIPCF
jgi:hypothetical protein